VKEPDKHYAIDVCQNRPSGHPPTKYVDLLPQDQILRLQLGSRLKERSQQSKDQLKQVGHQVAILRASLHASTPNRVFGTHSHRLPTACAQWLGWGEVGCLITYGEDANFEMGPRAAFQVIKILNGTKPSDIPIEQPSKFKLIVNAKTAKALSLTVPPSMLAMADEVIE